MRTAEKIGVYLKETSAIFSSRWSNLSTNSKAGGDVVTQLVDERANEALHVSAMLERA